MRPGWGRCSRPPCSPACQSWAAGTGTRSAPWSGWRPSTATAGHSGVAAWSGTAGQPRSSRTWPDRVHAQAPDDPERDAHTSAPWEPTLCADSLRNLLTPTTVAPLFPPRCRSWSPVQLRSLRAVSAPSNLHPIDGTCRPGFWRVMAEHDPVDAEDPSAPSLRHASFKELAANLCPAFRKEAAFKVIDAGEAGDLVATLEAQELV